MALLELLLLLPVLATDPNPACAETEGLQSLDEQQLDLAAYEAVRDDVLPRAVAAFSDMIRRDEHDSFAYMWRGHMHIRLGDLAAAEGDFAHAVDTVGQRVSTADENEAFALAAKKAQLGLSLRRVRERLAVKHLPAASGTPTAVRISPVQRIHHSELSHERFHAEFAVPRKPVIIEGFESLTPDANGLSLTSLRAACGHLTVPLKHHEPTSTSWGALEARQGNEALSFGEYLDQLASGTIPDGFVFDWSMRKVDGCRAVLAELSVPSYFTASILSGYGPSVCRQRIIPLA